MVKGGIILFKMRTFSNIKFGGLHYIQMYVQSDQIRQIKQHAESVKLSETTSALQIIFGRYALTNKMKSLNVLTDKLKIV